jgi:exodeoxyribonuclease VII large subunit
VRVVVWPVTVQGDRAAGEVRAAIEGFNRTRPGGPVPRPDVLIVARGGGSVEDLWPFNDEALARAAAESRIPLISAVGHETDTTLIDYVAARRAPTPTAAAEMATPVLAELRSSLGVAGARLDRALSAALESRSGRLRAASAALPRLSDLVELTAQRFDHVASRLSAALAGGVAFHAERLARSGGRLSPALLSAPVARREERLADMVERLGRSGLRRIDAAAERADLDHKLDRAGASLLRRLAVQGESLNRLDQLRRSLDPDRPLALGFARVHRASDGGLVTRPDAAQPGEALTLVFKGDARLGVRVEGEAAPVRARGAAKNTGAADQGSLF